jgi:hypothetical protein
MIKSYSAKIGKIFDQGIKESGKTINLSRKKCMFGIIGGIIESRSVVYEEIAQKMNEEVDDDSNIRRIQRYFSEMVIDYTQMAIILMSFIPERKLKLCIDRTNWKFGEVNINILTLTAKYKGVGIPIFFEMLDKRGNSSQGERIDLLDKFVSVFGKNRIACVLGDREFIGEKWYNYLLNSDIDFYIRILKSHLVELDDTIIPAFELLTGRTHRSVSQVKVNNVTANIGARYLKEPKDEEDKYLIVITNRHPDGACQAYRERWSIEVFFQSIKGRGFDIEATHLVDITRIKKLVAMVCLAFVWCLTIGVWKDETVKTLRIKNHGYKANSYFRYGLNHLRKMVRNISNKTSELSNFIDILWNTITKINLVYHLDLKNVM